MNPRTPIVALSALLFTAGAALGIARVSALERLEVDRASEWASIDARADDAGATPASVRLLDVALTKGQDAVFELCTDDGLPAAHWSGAAELAVWAPATETLLARVALDDAALARASRSSEGACLVAAEGEVPADGEYALELVWPAGPLPAAARAAALRARVLARPEAGPLGRVAVALIFVGALGVALALAWGRRADAPAEAEAGVERADVADPWPSPPASAARLAAGIVLALGAAGVLVTTPLPSVLARMLGGVAFAVVQIAIAFAIAPAPRRSALALEFPARATWVKLGAAAVASAALVVVARLAVDLVPSTGEAPIETFVSWPSGRVAFAVIAVTVPIAEELFFRGFVYGASRRFAGAAGAFAITVILFVAAHAPQTWGSWGGLSAVLVTGLVLTALRAWTGSLVVPIVAHLGYNGVLAITSLP